MPTQPAKATACNIINAINTGFEVSFSAGTVYDMLNRLEREGFINRTVGSSNISITQAGKELVEKAFTESEILTPKVRAFLKRK